jgi:hypothetical protein
MGCGGAEAWSKGRAGSLRLRVVMRWRCEDLDRGVIIWAWARFNAIFVSCGLP